MEVFAGTCGNLVSQGCADATFPPNGLVETYNAVTTVGQTYYVRIYCYTPPANVSTEFTICAFSAGGGNPPPNDACGDAVVENLTVPDTQSFSGDNTGATVDAPTNFSIVWHAFTIASCANVDINYCVPGSVFDDFLINLAVGCPDFITGVLTGTVSVDNCTLSFAQLPAGTYYVPVLVDATVTPIGAYTIEVSTTACGGPGYCDAGAEGSADFDLDERIVNVNFAGIDNDSPDVAPVPPAYSDFTAVSGSVQQGMDYPINVDVARTGANTSYSENQVLAWIDWNQDLDFDDAGEQVFVSTIGSVDIYTGTVSVPAGAAIGSTRMRIRLHDTHDGSDYINVINDTPCGLASYGEVEDYTINVTGGGPTPPNDQCFNVVPLPLSLGNSVGFSGDNTNATNTNDYVPGSDFDPMDPTVWHAFTTTECANVTVAYCNTAPAFGNVWIFLTQSCPVGNNYVLGAYESTSCAPNFTVSYFNLPAGTWYVPVLLDAVAPDIAQGPYSITVSATACASPGNYCEAGAVSLLWEKISNVTFGTINNNSTSAAGFEDFTALSTDVVGGQSYPISVTISGGYPTDQVLAWIDWDHNSTFDAGEIVMSSALGVGPHADNVSVPLTALPGPTRMRVRLHDTYVGVDYQNTPNPTPCDTSTFGQVEDYTVDMIGIITGIQGASATPWMVFPNPGNGDFTIGFSGGSAKVTVEVLDMTGRLVHSELRQFSTGTMEHLTLAGKLAAGTYTLRFTSDTVRDEQRIIVR
ncbi:MAG: T9SS type A sorting domain-containing protein [Flavobacteriales bacterium]|nr:T9SS type A sorting domain-containing protein [Flavobacteriales bacterium]